MFMFFPFMVNASSYSLSLNCPDTAKSGEIISCSLNASLSNLSGISAKYSFTNSLEYVDLVLDDSSLYTINVRNTNGFSLGNTSGLPESFKVGDLKLKIPTSATSNQEFKVTLNSLDGSDLDFNSVTGSNVSETIRIKSSNNELSSLTITGASIEFSKDVLSYNIKVDTDKITINATSSDKNAKVSGTGEKIVNYGSNKFEITVTAENGEKKVYTINVTRDDNRSAINTLKSLTVSNTKIKYNNSIDYTDTVEGDIEKVKIEAVATDETATITGVGEKKLEYCLNNFEVVVTAENGSKKTYTIKITRKDERSSDATLKSLLVGDIEIELDSSNTTYALTVKSDVELIELIAISTNSKATISGLGNKTLKTGLNTFEIKVVAENKEEKVYTLNITRVDDSMDNTLKSLEVSDTNINYNGNDVYNASVNYNITKVTVEAIANSSKALVTGNGSYDLVVGKNEIEIKVVASSGDEKIYTINVTREAEEIKVPSTGTNTSLIVIICALVFIIIGLIIFIIVREKKKIEVI